MATTAECVNPRHVTVVLNCECVMIWIFEFDKIYETNGIKVVCDIKSWFYVKGTEVDFSDDLLSGGFQLNNPNANRTCGCGTSFSA